MDDDLGHCLVAVLLLFSFKCRICSIDTRPGSNISFSEVKYLSVHVLLFVVELLTSST